jgi:hypothetical protein
MNVLATPFAFAETDQLMVYTASTALHVFILEVETHSALNFLRIETLALEKV